MSTPRRARFVGTYRFDALLFARYELRLESEVLAIPPADEDEIECLAEDSAFPIKLVLSSSGALSGWIGEPRADLEGTWESDGSDWVTLHCVELADRLDVRVVVARTLLRGDPVLLVEMCPCSNGEVPVLPLKRVRVP